jgi:hypothetical protein
MVHGANTIVSRDDKQAILDIFLGKLEKKSKLIEKYKHRPIEFLALKGSFYPSKLEKMFMDIYSMRVRLALIVGPRGGGKTHFFGDIAACLFLFKGFDALIGSGSDAQAARVYERVWELLGEDEEISEFVPNMTTRITEGKDGNWIEFVPASQKRARGPHPGEGKRGGLIEADEEAEMDPNILNALMGTGGTAKPLVVLRGSTAHKVDGTFAEKLDNPGNYTVYRWDAFDVCGKCELKCEECIPEFRKTYCKGKAKQNSILGWISLDYIFTMWQEMDKEWFEVELMGLRPSGAGLVIAPEDLKAALREEDVPYVPGAPNCAGIDWGFVGMTGVVATQMVKGRLQLFDRMLFTRKGIEDIIAGLIGWREMYGITEVYSDSSHPFENDSLRKAGFTVTEVTFVSFKDAGAGAVKGSAEKRLLDIPLKFKSKDAKKPDVVNQLAGWKRGKDGKIVKKDDHYCDALLCTMMKWWKKMKRAAGYLKVTRG